MHTIKNKNGNLVFYQSPNLKSCWGYIDEKGDYITDRDFSKGQIFRLFRNAMAIQLELLDYLEKSIPHGKIKIRVENYEKEPFWAIVKVKGVRKTAIEEFGKEKAIFNYDKKDYQKYGKQIMLPMNCFVREYDYQKKLLYKLK